MLNKDININAIITKFASRFEFRNLGEVLLKDESGNLDMFVK
jgi:hypothetical protein